MLWYAFPKQQLYEIQEQIRSKLNPHKAIQAFVEKKSPDSVVISIANNERIPVVILNGVLHDKKYYNLKMK